MDGSSSSRGKPALDPYGNENIWEYRTLVGTGTKEEIDNSIEPLYLCMKAVIYLNALAVLSASRQILCLSRFKAPSLTVCPTTPHFPTATQSDAQHSAHWSSPHLP